MDRPTLRQLEILAEIARVGTFRGAARHLGLSQVAVSDHVKQLETRLGVALFVRNAGGKPTLSAAGRIVLDHGRNVLFACDALIAAARAEGGDKADIITPVAPPPISPEALPVPPVEPEPEPEPDLAALLPRPSFLPILPPLGTEKKGTATPPPAVEPAVPEKADAPTFSKILREQEAAITVPEEQDVAAMMDAPATRIRSPDIIDDLRENPITVASHPAILSRFQDRLTAAQEAFPDRPITVDFARFTADAVAQAFRAGRADIALFYALGEVPGIPSDYLWSENWSLFARQDHPLARKEAVTLRDCDDMLVILFDEGNPIRPLTQACLAGAGLWPAPTVLETDDYAAIAAELDYGEAIFPAFGVTAQQFAARPGIRRLALVEPLPGVEIRRAIAPASEDDPTIAALAGLLG